MSEVLFGRMAKKIADARERLGEAAWVEALKRLKEEDDQ